MSVFEVQFRFDTWSEFRAGVVRLEGQRLELADTQGGERLEFQLRDRIGPPWCPQFLARWCAVLFTSKWPLLESEIEWCEADGGAPTLQIEPGWPGDWILFIKPRPAQQDRLKVLLSECFPRTRKSLV